jgi:hypothetical protein
MPAPFVSTLPTPKADFAGSQFSGQNVQKRQARLPAPRLIVLVTTTQCYILLPARKVLPHIVSRWGSAELLLRLSLIW